MSKELKSGPDTAKVETTISKSLKAKFARYCKKANTSQAQVTRDLIQGLLKKPK